MGGGRYNFAAGLNQKSWSKQQRTNEEKESLRILSYLQRFVDRRKAAVKRVFPQRACYLEVIPAAPSVHLWRRPTGALQATLRVQGIHLS